MGQIKKAYLAEIEARAAGLPCLLGVTHYFERSPDHGSRDSDMDYRGFVEVEWELLDRRGNPASWLMKKVSADEMGLLEDVLIERMRNGE